MKTVKITIATLLLLTSLSAKASIHRDTIKAEKIVNVEGNGKLIKLKPADVKYILSVTRNPATVGQLLSGAQTIRCNAAADVILAIMKARK